MPHRTRSHLLSFKITMSQRGALSEIPRPQPKAMSCHLYVSSARWTNAHDSTAHKSRHMFLHWTQHSFEWSQCLSREVLNEFCKQTHPKKTNHPEMLVSISSVIFLLFSLSMHLGVVFESSCSNCLLNASAAQLEHQSATENVQPMKQFVQSLINWMKIMKENHGKIHRKPPMNQMGKQRTSARPLPGPLLVDAPQWLVP